MVEHPILPTSVIFESLFNIVTYFADFLKPVVQLQNMKTSELFILLFIFLKGPKSMNQLAKFTSTTQSNVTSLIDNMEEANLLERVRSMEDRRVIQVQLTLIGTQMCKNTLAHFNTLVQEFLEQVKEEDLLSIAKGFTVLRGLTENPLNP